MSQFGAAGIPSPRDPRPAAPARRLDEQELESALSSLADHDVTEHARIYETLLEGLQQELNSSEHGA